jgi:hypothetical protein
MIIVDKSQRRPQSRLVGVEHAYNRETELVHESHEGYDYLIREYFLEPNSNTYLDNNVMVINTYLDNNVYKATTCHIDCETQGLHSPDICVPKQLCHQILSYREEFRQMIVPDHLTHRALGHPGFHRMWNTIRKSYFWKSMQTDVRLYCRNCDFCRSRKSISERGSVPIEGYYISERPWQRCHIDCMVGLPISDVGHTDMCFIQIYMFRTFKRCFGTIY